ncbi:hypothetical protein H6503_03845 [Candidatus Woesearchaeota archaeon]|nr:hypothetical protein [Candidatus Woesearchaeota archaeon]
MNDKGIPKDFDIEAESRTIAEHAYRDQYLGTQVTFRRENVPEETRQSLMEDGLIDGRSYKVTNLWYEPATPPNREKALRAKGLEGIIQINTSANIIVEVDVEGTKRIYAGQFFDVVPEAR